MHHFHSEHPSPELVGCRRARRGARPSGIAGVSKGFVQNCVAPIAVLCKTGGVESLKLPFAGWKSNWTNVALWYLRSAAKSSH